MTIRGENTKKPKGPSQAAQKEGGCVHHGPGCWHGTSECFIKYPELAPEGFDRDKAVESTKRFMKRRKAREKKGKQPKKPKRAQNHWNLKEQTVQRTRARTRPGIHLWQDGRLRLSGTIAGYYPHSGRDSSPFTRTKFYTVTLVIKGFIIKINVTY